jgi:transposase
MAVAMFAEVIPPRVCSSFWTIKQFRAIATRYDKTARNFLGAVYLTACAIWLN